MLSNDLGFDVGHLELTIMFAIVVAIPFIVTDDVDLIARDKALKLIWAIGPVVLGFVGTIGGSKRGRVWKLGGKFLI